MPPAPHVPGRELEGKPPSLTRRLRRKSDVPSLAWPMPPIRSPAARRIAEWFGLPLEARSSRPACGALAPGLAPCRAGQIMLITGASGAGKSTVLRQLARRARREGRHVIDIARVRLRQALPCVDQFGTEIGLALDLLNRVGLGEAYTYLRIPAELSDGQRWRLRLAIALAQVMQLHGQRGREEAPRDGCVLVADEFCAVLDRVSAAVVARGFRRTIERLARVGVDMAAMVATSHEDLEPALLPDVIVRCDFGRVDVEHPPPGSG